MKTRLILLLFCFCVLANSCTNKLTSGEGYPALALGDVTLVYKLSKVMQNDIDVKPHFDFFETVEFTLSYVGGKPTTLSLTEGVVPFKVTTLPYTDKLEESWEIYTLKSPYEIRVKGTEQIVGYLHNTRMVTMNFKLGCPSNSYEYQLLPIENE